tara:strand:+ start:596 stop:1795 length:1200 start_codon:yes stop_codon:yes gene_type:complete
LVYYFLKYLIKMKKKIIILGSTGSIGKNLFQILKKDKKKFEILLLSINKNYNELLKQLKIFKIKNIIIIDKNIYIKAKKNLKNYNINIYNNFNSIKKILKGKRVDYTMSAISGLSGLQPTLEVIKYTNNIAVANKESIICGWELILNNLKKYKCNFIPVDSEHFSIMSLINNQNTDTIDKIYITASGGPFNKYPLKKFKSITIQSALNHPNWKMGKKITIDSATMMNKVFEIIEAKKIFNISYNKLNILVHPKSYIHALVKFSNGLTKILIHDTDMKIPIFNSLYLSSEKKLISKKLNLNILNNLNLHNVNQKRFPSVKILNLLPKKNSLFETIIVSANDKLVEMFLNKRIKFLDISKVLLKILKLKEFTKYKKILPQDVAQIEQLSKYVSLKIEALSI